MKYIISESQYDKLKEQFDFEENNNVVGNPSEEVLIVADFLNRYDIVEPGDMLIKDNSIEIFGFENNNPNFFLDDMISLNIYPSKGDIWINVEWGEDVVESSEDFNEMIQYIKELASNYSMFYWAIGGEPIWLLT